MNFLFILLQVATDTLTTEVTGGASDALKVAGGGSAGSAVTFLLVKIYEKMSKNDVDSKLSKFKKEYTGGLGKLNEKIDDKFDSLDKVRNEKDIENATKLAIITTHLEHIMKKLDKAP